MSFFVTFLPIGNGGTTLLGPVILPSWPGSEFYAVLRGSQIVLSAEI
jgi:hypothetical protein